MISKLFPFVKSFSASGLPLANNRSLPTSATTSISRILRHGLHLFLLGCLLLFFLLLNGVIIPDEEKNVTKTETFDPKSKAKIDPWTTYGILTYLFYLIRLTILLGIPICIFNFLGLVLINIVPPPIHLQASSKSLLAPFLCFRVVTRGTYKSLVHNNVDRNLEVLKKVGLENFVIEVVTDNALDLKKQPYVREIVVPTSYVTNNKTLYKARALQYCLEEGVNLMNDDDWVVHLDEETILTEGSVKGVFNFAYEGKYHFGQGVINYTNLGIQNLMLTLADSVRVAIDHGMLRFQFTYLHLPIFSWKGSFVVTNAGAERQVTWDHGPESSIAEDCFFAMVAMSKGYRFSFIQGEMWESSPFTMMDYIKQRKRWLYGLTLTFWSARIPAKFKVGIFFMVWAWTLMPLTTSNIVWGILYPFTWRFFDIACSFFGATYLYLFMLGAAKSFSPARIGWFRYIGVILLSLCAIPFVIVGENAAALWVIFGRKMTFDIIQKDPAMTATQSKAKAGVTTTSTTTANAKEEQIV